MDDAFTTQCNEISDKLSGLSDWEMKFYLHCLLPRYADTLNIIQEPDTVTEYLANEQTARIKYTIRIICDVLAMDLF